MASKLEQNVEALVNETVEKLGFEIEYVEYIKEGTEKILRIVIDHVGDLVSIDDCEKVSKAIEDMIEESNLVKQEYVLEISSPGVERVLKNDRLYEKYKDKKIRFSLYKQIDGKKILEGNILNLYEDKIEVESEGKAYIIDKSNIAVANTVYDF